MRRIRSGFALEVFDRKNAHSPRLARFLRIYVSNFGKEHRTKTNEILDFLVAPPDERDMVCLGLSHGDRPRGFALLTIFEQAQVAIIDHLVVEPGSRGNGAFFCFADLIANYLEESRRQLDHLVAEVVVDERYMVSNVRPNMLIRLMRIIGFKVAKAKYWAPDPLILESLSACRAAFMIASQPERNHLSPSEFVRIARLVYDQHYGAWYRKVMPPELFRAYEEKCQGALSQIEQLALREKSIRLNGLRDLDAPLLLDPSPRTDVPTFAYLLLVAIPAFVGAAVAFKQEWQTAVVTAAITLAALAVCALTPRLRRPLLRLFRLAE